MKKGRKEGRDGQREMKGEIKEGRGKILGQSQIAQRNRKRRSFLLVVMGKRYINRLKFHPNLDKIPLFALEKKKGNGEKGEEGEKTEEGRKREKEKEKEGIKKSGKRREHKWEREVGKYGKKKKKKEKEEKEEKNGKGKGSMEKKGKKRKKEKKGMKEI